MKTVLYSFHCALGAKIVDFAGWEMPLQYEGVLHEHHCVRERVGVFDVSHMGQILISGPEAERFVDYLSSNRLEGKQVGSAVYTVLCDAQGLCVDDVIISRIGLEDFILVANATNQQKVLEHIQSVADSFAVEVVPQLDHGILAVQGPNAPDLLEKLFPEVRGMKPMRVLRSTFEGREILLSSTGYTGEYGFEIVAENALIVPLWEQLFVLGKELGIAPIGLGARDTLRLEMGFALYGNEIGSHIAPTESVAAWTVQLDKGEFIGKESLLVLEQSGNKRAEFGVILKERSIPRKGCEVYRGEERIGIVTSGTFSPSLQRGICIVLGQEKLGLGEGIDVLIRGKRVAGEVAALPFYKIPKKRKK